MAKVKEIVSINVGKAGCQIGNECFKLYAEEHQIGRNLETQNPFFDKNCKGKSIANTIFVDLEPNTINHIRKEDSPCIYDETCFISGREDAAGNFARGYWLIDDSILDQLDNKIRQIAESKSNLQGFIITHAFGGGTGSGFMSRMVENLSAAYPKKTKISFSGLSGNQMASGMDVYNTVLGLHKTIDSMDVSFLFNNESIANILESKYGIEWPEFEDINELIVQTMSSITASTRFDGGMNKLLKEFPVTLAPFQKLHFPIAGFAPLTPDQDMSLLELSTEALKPGNQLVEGNFLSAKSMSCSYLYRGNVQMNEANKTIKQIKAKKLLTFSAMPFETYKVSVIKKAAVRLPGAFLPSRITESCACVLVNGTAICDTLTSLVTSYELLRKENAYIHWLASEGLENSTLEAAEDDVKILNNDYLQDLQ